MSRKVTSASTRQAPGWISRAVLGTLSATAMFGLWLLLVDTFERPELQAGAGAAVLTAIVMVAVLRGELAWLIALRQLRGVWRLPLRGLRASVLVVVALLLHVLGVRPAEGAFHTSRTDEVEPGTAAATRRALLVLQRSFPPDTAVIGFNRARASLVFHQFPALDAPRRATGGRR